MNRYPQIIVLTAANTEYPQVVETGAKVIGFVIRGRVGTLRFATETGKVAGPTEPYSTLVGGEAYDMRDIVAGPSTFYFASSTAGLIVEMEVWA